MWSNEVEEFIEQLDMVVLKSAIKLEFDVEDKKAYSVSKGVLIGWTYVKSTPPILAVAFEGNTQPFMIDFSKIDKVTLVDTRRTQ